MATLKHQKKSRKGIKICGRVGCGREIQPGEMYWSWAFRNTGKQARCDQHPPKRSELTESKLSDVYAAIENFETEFANGAESFEAIEVGVIDVAEAARTVVDEYREAAENFGGYAESAERADELEGWVEQLDSYDTSEWNEEKEEFDEEVVGPELSQKLFGIDEPSELDEEQRIVWQDAMQTHRDGWEGEQEPDTEKIEEALTAAQELMNELSL